MHSRTRVAAAVAAVLNGSALCGIAHAAKADVGHKAQQALQLQQIVVTATRTRQTIQNVPITMRALSAAQLSALNSPTLNQFVEYLPNVTAANDGPGQTNVIIRGVSVGSDDIQGTGIIGSLPTVATYIDDESGQAPGRNLDVYAADLNRIEVLEGPQGTLFGAGAEAGVVRYITNKPKLNVTEGGVTADYEVTAHGDPSTGATGVINLPLVRDRLAARLVIYDNHQGGYINNIPATFTRSPTDLVSVNYFGGTTPPNSGPINNYAFAGRAINPLSYQGARLEVLYKINDDWRVLLTQMYQNMDAEGVFWQEAYDGLGKPLPPLSVELFNPAYNKDRFENTAWTVHGAVGPVRLLYTGSYLDRNVHQEQDYTNYSRGEYAGYYQCNYPGYPFNSSGQPTAGSSGYCYSPRTFWSDIENMTHEQQELRFSTPSTWRLRGVLGLFYEKYHLKENTDWFYGTSPNFNPIGPPTIDPQTGGYLPATSTIPGVRPAGDAFFVDAQRGYSQKAVYTSWDFDLIPHALTITAGTRYYYLDTYETGSSVGSFGCEVGGPYDGGSPPNPCVSTPQTGVLSNLANLTARNLRAIYQGWRSSATLTWHVTPDKMLYATWSQGYRPGGFNRGQGVITPNSPLYGIYTVPLSYSPDSLTNSEIGWKTDWLHHRLRVNGAFYQDYWDNVQLSIFDPGVTGSQDFVANGPNYRIRGVELQVDAIPVRGLTLRVAGAWNSSTLIKTQSLIDPATGQPISIVNPFGTLGTPLANSPPFKFSAVARYAFPVAVHYQGFVQAAVTHIAHSLASTDLIKKTLQGQSEAFNDPGYTTLDASVGVSRDRWTVTLYGVNLTNRLGIQFSSYSQWVKEEDVIRPRTIGLKIGYSFRNAD